MLEQNANTLNETITLKEITDMIGTRHTDAKLTVQRMSKDPEFGPFRVTPYYLPVSHQKRAETIETYVLTKGQSIAVASKLNILLVPILLAYWTTDHQGQSLAAFCAERGYSVPKKPAKSHPQYLYLMVDYTNCPDEMAVVKVGVCVEVWRQLNEVKNASGRNNMQVLFVSSLSKLAVEKEQQVLATYAHYLTAGKWLYLPRNNLPVMLDLMSDLDE
jgi:hypothetical protein